MSSDPNMLTSEAKAASQQAVHAQKNAAQAVETARAVQAQAIQDSTTQSFIEAIKQAFGSYTDQQRFIDLKQVPLLCKQVLSIHDDIKEIKEMMRTNDARYVNQDQFAVVKALSYGLAGAVLSGFVAALLALVFR